MGLTQSLNSALTRATGFRLTRAAEAEATHKQSDSATPQAVKQARKDAAQQFRQRIATLRDQNAQLKQRNAQLRDRNTQLKDRAAAARKKLPAHLDPTTRATIEQVLPRTMTAPAKLEALVDAVRYLERHGVPGAMVECGVWRGGSMQAVAITLLELGSTDRELHLFDTYEGMPAPTEEDRRARDGSSAADLLATSTKDSRVWAHADLPDVQAGMAETEYPADKVHFHVGMVEQNVPDLAPPTIALLRLDTDWYASTLHELRHLYDRLSPGGVLILDDYGDWDGARKATEEWLAETGARLFLAPMATGRIAVKPFAV